MRQLSAALTITIIGVVSIAEAQTGWTGTVTTISAPVVNYGRHFRPVIAVDPNGNAYAIWDQIEGVPASTRIKAARYVAGTDSWSAPITLAGPGDFALPGVAVDALGNAFFVVTRRAGGHIELQVHRYSLASGTITTTTLATPSFASALPAQVVVDSAGNATVVWEGNATVEGDSIHAARYDYAAATWSSPVKVSAGQGPRIAIDGRDDIAAISIREIDDFVFVLEAARFDSSTLTWSQAIDVPTGRFGGGPWDVAADHDGNVTVVWQSNLGTVRSARLVKATGAWGGVTDLSAPGAIASDASVAADRDGNVIAVWRRGAGPNFFIQAARYDAASASWGSPIGLSSLSGYADPGAQVQMDAAGNAIALWARSQPGFGFQIQAVRYTASANQWSAPTDLSALGQTARNADISFDAAGNGTAVWFQAAGGLGAIQTTRWIEHPPVAPDPATDLVVSSVTGNTVTLAWKAPVSGTPPTGYVLEGGLSPGSVLASMPTGGTASSFTFTAPSGVFFARLHAVSGNLRSAASNEIQLVVDAPLSPSAPAALLGLVNGSKLALSWTNTFQGGAPTALQLNVTGDQAGSFPLGVVDTLSFTGVPGTYTFTLTASNAAGVSPPSNPVTLTIPDNCSGAPGVPTYFAVAKSGSTLTMTWHPPVSGAAVTNYVIHASGALTGSLSTVARSFSVSVGPGTYSLSVVAANECGTSAPSNVITVTVP
jgi:hypothetical protein